MVTAIVCSMFWSTSSQRTTGLDLKFARLARGVAARQVAACLGVSPQRVSTIEASLHPSLAMVARYRAALDHAGSSEGTGQEAMEPSHADEGPR